ncbi:hypothetical protein PCE1_001413 [Barthelona sp. PCE]
MSFEHKRTAEMFNRDAGPVSKQARSQVTNDTKWEPILLDNTNTFAFATVIFNDPFIPGALVLGKSLENHHGDAIDRICFISPEVSNEGRNALELVFNHVIEVPYIEHNVEAVRWKRFKDRYTWVRKCFTKLHCLRLTTYAKVLFLDADVLCMANLADAFERDHPFGILMFDSVVDINNAKGFPDSSVRDRSLKNSYGFAGCFVGFVPSMDTFKDILDLLYTKNYYGRQNYNAGPDEQLVTEYFGGKMESLDAEYCCVSWKAAKIAELGGQVRLLHFVTATPWDFDEKGKIWDDYCIWLQFARSLLLEIPALRPFLPIERMVRFADNNTPEVSSLSLALYLSHELQSTFCPPSSYSDLVRSSKTVVVFVDAESCLEVSYLPLVLPNKLIDFFDVFVFVGNELELSIDHSKFVVMSFEEYNAELETKFEIKKAVTINYHSSKFETAVKPHTLETPLFVYPGTTETDQVVHSYSAHERISFVGLNDVFRTMIPQTKSQSIEFYASLFPNEQYVPPQDNKQIAALFKDRATKRVLLGYLKSSAFRGANRTSLLYALNRADVRGDKAVYKMMHYCVHNAYYNPRSRKNNRAERKAQDFMDRLREAKISIPAGNTFLDYGCGDATISVELGRMLGSGSVYAADVRPIAVKGSNLTFLQVYDNKISIPDNSVDICTCSAVFHHVENFSEVADELMRVLKPGGTLIIKEHDCHTVFFAMWLDVMHGFYSLVTTDPQEDPLHVEMYHSYYRPMKAWKAAFLERSYEFLHSHRVIRDDCYRSCFLVLRKPLVPIVPVVEEKEMEHIEEHTESISE